MLSYYYFSYNYNIIIFSTAYLIAPSWSNRAIVKHKKISNVSIESFVYKLEYFYYMKYPATHYILLENVVFFLLFISQHISKDIK